MNLHLHSATEHTGLCKQYWEDRSPAFAAVNSSLILNSPLTLSVSQLLICTSCLHICAEDLDGCQKGRDGNAPTLLSIHIVCR